MLIDGWYLAGGIVYVGGCAVVCAVCTWSSIRSQDRAFSHADDAKQDREDIEEMIGEFRSRDTSSIPAIVTGWPTPKAEVPEIDQLASTGPFGDGQGCP